MIREIGKASAGTGGRLKHPVKAFKARPEHAFGEVPARLQVAEGRFEMASVPKLPPYRSAAGRQGIDFGTLTPEPTAIEHFAKRQGGRPRQRSAICANAL